MEKLGRDTIIHFILGRCTEEEVLHVKQWIDADKQHAKQLFEMEHIYQQLQSKVMPTEQIERALKRVHLLANPSKKAKTTWYYRLIAWRNAAAVVLFIMMLTASIGLYWGYYKAQTMIVVNTNANTTKKILLPDGSKVWLNHSSSLRYPQKFNDSKRYVRLDGEAFFEVKKNKETPFVVENKALQVTVLGTVFNFNNNVIKKYSEVSLLEGKVEVKSNCSDGQIVLTPGQKATLDYTTGQITISNINDDSDAVWHTHFITFSNATIAEIVQRLEKLYGVKIQITKGINLKNTYSGKIKQKVNIDSVLHLLQNTLPITFKKTNTKTYIVVL